MKNKNKDEKNVFDSLSFKIVDFFVNYGFIIFLCLIIIAAILLITSLSTSHIVAGIVCGVLAVAVLLYVKKIMKG